MISTEGRSDEGTPVQSPVPAGQRPVGRHLQWGGRFSSGPDSDLLAFGSSLEEDLILAPFDVACSRAHVVALRDGGIIDPTDARALDDALLAVEREIADGSFARAARGSGAEDVHGAIDGRVRELVASQAGESLHAGRSRNDQVATTLLLYVRDRAAVGVHTCTSIARDVLAGAKTALDARTMMAAATHWQPAQPILLAFWLESVAELFVRGAQRFVRVRDEASGSCPLGSGACSGSSLPLARAQAAAALGFSGPSRNALDAIGNRDVALDLLHAVARALTAASRVSEEIVLYCTPAFGYARLDDAAATGSSLMPQKRNPDPFELVRASAASSGGTFAAALATTGGLALSYHRDLQETKRLVIDGTERGLRALHAFWRALGHVRWNASAMESRATQGYTVATDIADALVLRGMAARKAHQVVGAAVSAAEAAGRPLRVDDLRAIADDAGIAPFDPPLDARASIAAKATAGSTHPDAVQISIAALEHLLETEFAPS